jgi:hypothetical protein
MRVASGCTAGRALIRATASVGPALRTTAFRASERRISLSLFIVVTPRLPDLLHSMARGIMSTMYFAAKKG